VSTARESEWERRTRRARERAEHVAEHGPGCELCGNVPKSGGLHADHDHKGDGRTRGWLCHRCNRALPTFVTPEWLRAAAVYLERSR
jgi:Recombination endonuclease VII